MWAYLKIWLWWWRQLFTLGMSKRILEVVVVVTDDLTLRLIGYILRRFQEKYYYRKDAQINNSYSYLKLKTSLFPSIQHRNLGKGPGRIAGRN